jgi:membrane carboxypeptidase/penicillin-binding protein PbpC
MQLFDANRLGLSVALGTYETSPLEFTRLWTHWLKDKNISTNQIIQILSNHQNRLISFGIDNYLNRTGWFVKTGTSRKFIDGWTC